MRKEGETENRVRERESKDRDLCEFFHRFLATPFLFISTAKKLLVDPNPVAPSVFFLLLRDNCIIISCHKTLMIPLTIWQETGSELSVGTIPSISIFLYGFRVLSTCCCFSSGTSISVVPFPPLLSGFYTDQHA